MATSTVKFRMSQLCALLLLVASVVVSTMAATSPIVARANGGSPAVTALAPQNVVTAQSQDVTASATVFVNGVAVDMDYTGFNHWGQKAEFFNSRREVRIPYGNKFTVSVSAETASYFAINFVKNDVYDVTSSARTSADGVHFDTESVTTNGCGGLVNDSGVDGELFGGQLSARGIFRISSTTTPSTSFICHVEFDRGEGIGVYVEVGPSLSASNRVDITDERAEVFGFTVFSEAESMATDLVSFRDGVAATVSASSYPSLVSSSAVTAVDHGFVAGQWVVVDFPNGELEDERTGVWVVDQVTSTDTFELVAIDDLRSGVSLSAMTNVSVSALSLKLEPCQGTSPGPCLESIDSGWGAQFDDGTYSDCFGFNLCLDIGVYRVSASATRGFGTAPGDEVDVSVRLPVGEFRGAFWGNDALSGVNLMTLDSTASIGEYDVTQGATSAVHSFTVTARERSIAVDSQFYQDQCRIFFNQQNVLDSEGCELPENAKEITGIRVSAVTTSAVAGKAIKAITGYEITTSATTGVYDVTISVEALHGYEIGDNVSLTMPGSPLHDVTTSVVGIGGLTPDVSNIFNITVSAGTDISTAGPVVVTQSVFVDVTAPDHGLFSGDSVTITLLGQKFDGTKHDITVVDDDTFRFTYFGTISDEFSQTRNALVRKGQSSRVVLTDTSIELSLTELVAPPGISDTFLQGLALQGLALQGLAGGYVATNGQSYSLGDGAFDPENFVFDFAVAGPSEKQNRDSRSTDGFFEVCIPEGFLDLAFDLTVAEAADELIVTRDGGTAALSGLTFEPSPCGLGPGLKITNPSFGYSTPYFAATKPTSAVDDNPRSPGGGGGTSSGGALPGVPRSLAGSDRIATALAIVEEDFAPVTQTSAQSVGVSVQSTRTADAAVVVSATSFADSLTAGPLAVAKNAPLFLTGGSSLDPRVATALTRFVPKNRTVYIVGGEAAVSASVAESIRALGYTVVRLAGPDRYATSVAVARDGIGDTETLVAATGLDFPDGLAAGVVAARLGGAVVLTRGAQVPPVVQSYVTSVSPTTLIAVGGPASTAFPNATKKLQGSDRYATAVAVATAYPPTGSLVGAASGEIFADGLASVPYLARRGSVLLLVKQTTVPTPTTDFLANRPSVRTVQVFGGTSTVSQVTRKTLSNIVS